MPQTGQHRLFHSLIVVKTFNGVTNFFPSSFHSKIFPVMAFWVIYSPPRRWSLSLSKWISRENIYCVREKVLKELIRGAFLGENGKQTQPHKVWQNVGG